MKQQYESFIKDYLDRLNGKSAAIFAGAGLSVAAGYVNWQNLLRDIAKDVGLDVEKEGDLVSLAQFHVNKHRSPSKLTKTIINEFEERAEETENHKILARLPISTYWTTNYDSLIEETLEKVQKVVEVKDSPNEMASSKNKRDAIVYKMHGGANHASKAVLTKDHFERYYYTHSEFITALSADLISKTFLFLGISFSDPNLIYVLSRLRGQKEESDNHHYCLMKKFLIEEDATGDKKAEQEYKRRRQELMIDDLRRYGIQTVEIDSYGEITEILREIERRYKQQTIFISGSAEEYGEWERGKALSFVHSLSKALVKGKYRVVNGFGWGIGSAVINGALETIYDKPHKYSEDQLILRPFPQFKTGDKELPDLWQEYRERMLSFAGVSIYIFGNKIEDGSIVNAGGIRKEFDIARNNDNAPIPIGATGYMAAELHTEVLENFQTFYPDHPAVRSHLEALGNKDATQSQLIKGVLAILEIIKG